MAWNYREYLARIDSLRKELTMTDLEDTANAIEKVAGYLGAGLTGVLFGPSYLIYRFAKFLFEPEQNPISNSLWMYWAGQIVLPACYKKGVFTDMESMNPGNWEERNIVFCFNLPMVSEGVGESILREVRNRIANTYNISVLEMKYYYDISYSRGQIRISKCDEVEQNV